MNAFIWLQALLDVAGSQPCGGKVRQCPAHTDAAPSLSIAPGRDGSVLVHCFSGCATSDVLAALHCAPTRLFRAAPVDPAAYAEQVRLSIAFPKVEIRQGHPAVRGYRLEAVHDYGRALLERWRSRSGAKELAWYTRMPDGSTIPGLIGVSLADLPLYREVAVWQAMAVGDPVILVESESSVDYMTGWTATTWPGGAESVPVTRIVDLFTGYGGLVIVPDADTAGVRWVRRLQVAGLVAPVLWPAEGEDARDYHRRIGEIGFLAALNRALNRQAVTA